MKRLLKSNGVFAFSFDHKDDLTESIEIEPDIWQKETNSGVLTYKYSDEYISKLLETNMFKTLSKRQFLAFTNQELEKNIYFTAIVARLSPCY